MWTSPMPHSCWRNTPQPCGSIQLLGDILHTMNTGFLIVLTCLLASNLSAADKPSANQDYRADTPGFELPATAEKRLLEQIHHNKVVYIREMAYARRRGFDYLGIFAGFEKNSGFESVWHQTLVLRKKSDEPDWSKAELFRCEGSISVLLESIEEEDLNKRLLPWPPK